MLLEGLGVRLGRYLRLSEHLAHDRVEGRVVRPVDVGKDVVPRKSRGEKEEVEDLQCGRDYLER